MHLIVWRENSSSRRPSQLVGRSSYLSTGCVYTCHLVDCILFLSWGFVHDGWWEKGQFVEMLKRRDAGLKLLSQEVGSFSYSYSFSLLEFLSLRYAKECRRRNTSIHDDWCLISKKEGGEVEEELGTRRRKSPAELGNISMCSWTRFSSPLHFFFRFTARWVASHAKQ